MGILGRNVIQSDRMHLGYPGGFAFWERNELTQEVDIDRITMYGSSAITAGTRVKIAIYSNKVGPDPFFPEQPYIDWADRLLAESEELIWEYKVDQWHVHKLLSPVHLTPGIYWLVFLIETDIWFYLSTAPYNILYGGDDRSYRLGFPDLAPDWTSHSPWYGRTKYAGTSIYTGLGLPETTLTITATVGGTTNPAPGTYPHSIGDVVTVTAIADAGYTFDRWELDGTPVSTVISYNVTMDTDHVLHAVFVVVVPGKGTLEVHAFVR